MKLRVISGARAMEAVVRHIMGARLLRRVVRGKGYSGD